MKYSFTYLIAALLILLATSVYAAENRYDVPVEDSPAWGPVEAPVTMIEFIDYQ